MKIRSIALCLGVVMGLVACAEDPSSSDVSDARTKNAALTTCTFDTKCAVGSAGAAGGTVIYNAPTSFNCGPTSPIQLKCNFLEIAPAEWGSTFAKTASTALISNCQTAANNVDLKCTWSGMDGPQATSTKSELGASKKNFEVIKASLQDVNAMAPAVAAPNLYTSPAAVAGIEANPFGLPSLAELNLVCNYANGTAMRTDGCTPGTLRSGFQADWYWSSTIAGTDVGQPVYAVNFKTGEVQKLARKTFAYLRPIRTFNSTLDTSAVTTMAPTTVATTRPAVPTTAAPARVRACTPTSPCKPGDQREGTGGTVFLYSSTGFGCGSNPSSMRCAMMEYAQDGWASTLPSSVKWNGCLPKTGVDPTCPYTNGSWLIGVNPSADLGLGYQNSSEVANIDFFAASNFAWNFRQDKGVAFQSWNLPSLAELVQLCNWANGSAPRSDVCTPGVLKPNFQRGVYISSTVDMKTESQPVWVVDFGTGQVFTQARTISSFVRPVRTLRGYIEPGYVTPTTVAVTTPLTQPPTTVAPPTTVVRTTLPPTTLPPTTLPPTTIARTTLPPTTLPPTTLAPTTVPTCATGGVCRAGDVGPGGGVIVFVSSSGFLCGQNLEKTCMYLEAAPENWTVQPKPGCNGEGVAMTCPWPIASSGNKLGTRSNIGEGARNTSLMLATAPSFGAAATVRSYNGGGKTDWFIPSYFEANEFCKWAHFGLSGQTLSDPGAMCKISFHRTTFYNKPSMMTSSESNETNVYAYLINASSSTGPLVKDTDKTGQFMVWPMRAF